MVKVKVTYHFDFDTALYIGSGVSGKAIRVDKATTRNAEGDLIIPGSALKGRLRQHCEDFLRTLGVAVCDSPRAENMCPHFRDYLKPIGIEHDFCPACLIFGSPWRRSPLNFSDAVWEREEGWKIEEWKLASKDRTNIRPGVSISRNRGTALDERLYYTEVAQPHALFSGSIKGELNSRCEVAILQVGLKFLFSVGGGNSRGFGWLSEESTSQTSIEILVDDAVFTQSESVALLEEWICLTKS